MFYIYDSYSIFEKQNTGDTNTDQVQIVCAVWSWLKSRLRGVVRKPNFGGKKKEVRRYKPVKKCKTMTLLSKFNNQTFKKI